MKALAMTAAVSVGAVLVGLLATGAQGQYYVPLRYDLRYTPNPGYIGASPYGYAPPARPDPYAFGSVQYGNLELTGNVRAGKSFRGTVPYNQQGSQLSANLPSTSLSNFKRDSIGIEDLGTGVEYGAPAPYFSGSSSVTSLSTAQTRFATPPLGARAPYALPNLNTPYLPPTPMPSGISYASSASAQAGAPPAAMVRPPGGLYVPRSAIEWVNALAAGVAAQRAALPETPEEQKMDPRLGLPSMPTDLRIGIGPQPPTAAEAMKPPEAAAPGTEAPQVGTGAAVPQEQPSGNPPSALFWKQQAPPAAPAGQTPEAVPETGPFLPQPNQPRAFPKPERELLGLPPGEETPPGIPPPPQKYAGPGGFAEFVERGHEAMKRASYGQAEALYEGASVLDPNRPSALFGRIYALMGDRRYEQAALVLNRAFLAHTDWTKDVPDITAVYPKPEVYDRIVGDLIESLRNRPTSAEFNFLLGYVYYASGKKDDAQPYLKQAASIRGDKPGAERILLAAIEAGAKK